MLYVGKDGKTHKKKKDPSKPNDQSNGFTAPATLMVEFIPKQATISTFNLFFLIFFFNSDVYCWFCGINSLPKQKQKKDILMFGIWKSLVQFSMVAINLHSCGTTFVHRIRGVIFKAFIIQNNSFVLEIFQLFFCIKLTRKRFSQKPKNW